MEILRGTWYDVSAEGEIHRREKETKTMRETLMERCELFADNNELIRKKNIWDRDLMTITAGMIFTEKGVKADTDKMKECNKILKKHEGCFSNFRNNIRLSVVSKMAVSENPEEYLKEVINIYKKLHAGRITGSEYMALTATIICDLHREGEIDAIIEKTKLLMKKMEKRHPIMTGQEDLALLALLAMTDKEVDSIVEETEFYFKAMKKKFSFHGNAVQSLSFVMALMEGAPEEKCAKVIEIYKALTARGIKYGKEQTLASLGALIGTELDSAELAGEIVEASEYLKTRKGFGAWRIYSSTRHMFAALMAADVYAKDNAAMNSSVMSGALSIIIAEEIAMLVVITVCAANSSHSH